MNIDRALRALMYGLAAAQLVVGIWTIIKLLGFDPEETTLITIVAITVAFTSTLALKVGRIQGRIEKA